MLLIVFLGLIAKLAFVSGNCDLGTPTLHDFDFSRFSGPRTWYWLWHHDHDTENNFDCFRGLYGSPEGNRSLIRNDVHDIRERSHRAHHGYITNWNTTGYFDLSHALTHIDGQFLVIAIDYDRYIIGKHCRDETHELTVYVGYRSPRPDQETVNEVQRQLQDKTIDVSQLMEWAAESSAAGGSSA